MSQAYEEILHGESVLRSAPDLRHELICQRLHERIGKAVAVLASTRLLPPRSVVRISPGSIMRPDLALVTAANGKLWLAGEVNVEPQADSRLQVTFPLRYELRNGGKRSSGKVRKTLLLEVTTDDLQIVSVNERKL